MVNSRSLSQAFEFFDKVNIEIKKDNSGYLDESEMK